MFHVNNNLRTATKAILQLQADLMLTSIDGLPIGFDAQWVA